MKIDCIFIGQRFYFDSGTIISSVYEVTQDGRFHRTDWGKLQICLEKGVSISIRPATPEELQYFDELLLNYKR